MLKFQVTNGQGLWRTDKNIVSADTTDLKVGFELTSDFTGTITVWWRRSDVNNTYTSMLAADGTCTIPAEALAATDKAVYGPYDHDVFVSISDTGRTTTNEYKLTVLRSAFSTNATPGTGGNPTAYEELVEQFDELKADNQTFKDNMTEQQETFESTVTENVNNIRYVVETETAPPIIEEASGAEITLDDSAYRQVRGLQLYGYSKQVQTTGAQLLDYSTLSGAQNGITPSIDDDNYIVLNGTATANAFIYVLCNIPSGTSMFISVNNPVLNNNISVYIRDEESTHSSEYIALDTANKTHAFASVSVAISRFAIRVVQGATLTNFRLRPMLNSGTSALPWEPYSGGVASPSPDWAQPIHSVADGGSVTVRSTGANLMDITKLTRSKTQGGVTQQILDDGASVISGTGSTTQVFSNNYRLTDDEKKYFVSDDYTISGAKHSFPYPFFRIDKSDGLYEEINLYNANTETREYSISDDDSISFGFYASTGKTIGAQTSYPMLNRGSTALPWQPYVSPSSALISLTDSLRGIPVDSGGNYTDDDGQQWIADYIYRRVTDGKWMLWRNCGAGVYDGSEDESWRALSTFPDRYAIFNGGALGNVFNEKSTNFIADASLSRAGTFQIDINKDVVYKTQFTSNLGAWKTWLSSNPQTVVYQLATPTIEELPENVQTELNGLMTYNLHTDMWNNDGAYMNLKYVADTKTWINNKIAGISTAMIENL